MDRNMHKVFEERALMNRFAAYNHIKMVDMDTDWALVELTIWPESKNPYGVVHGGALYTMADNAAGIAAHSDGGSYVTQFSSMHYLRNQIQGTIRAEGRVRHRGRSTCLVEVSITGEGGRLMATGSFTFFRVDEKKMPQNKAAAQGAGGDA